MQAAATVPHRDHGLAAAAAAAPAATAPAGGINGEPAAFFSATVSSAAAAAAASPQRGRAPPRVHGFLSGGRRGGGDGRGGGGPEVDWTTPEWLEYERRSLLLLQLAFLLHLDRFWLRHTRLRVIVLTPDKDSTTLILRLRQVMRDARIYADVVAVSL